MLVPENFFVYFFITSDPNLAQTLLLTRKLTSNLIQTQTLFQTHILTFKNVNNSARLFVPFFRFILFNLKIHGKIIVTPRKEKNFASSSACSL